MKNKIGNANARKLKRYLNCAEHKEIRLKLRNQFTHALDNTSSYIFHRVNSGKMQADLSNMFPKHPYENIVLVLDDIQKYLEFAKSYVGKLEKFLNGYLEAYQNNEKVEQPKIALDILKQIEAS